MKVVSSLFCLGALVGSAFSTNPTRGQPTNPDIVIYIEDWAVYARDFDLSDFEKNTLQRDLPYNRMILNYAFLQVNPTTCRLEQLDGWAFNQKESNNSGEFPSASWDEVKGQIAGFQRIQERYPSVYVVPSIGGWSRSHGFEDCVKPGKRETLIEHIVEVLEYYKWDGIDFDWEFPGCDPSDPCGCQGEEVCTVNPNTGAPRDTQNRSSKEDWPVYQDFMREVRAALDTLATKVGKDRLLLSAAIGMSPRVLKGNGDTSPLPTPVEFFCNEDTMDFVNLMTYDYFGAWSAQTGPLAPLYDTPGVTVDDEMNIDFGVKYLLSKCLYPEKLNMGLATYGKIWRQVPKGSRATPGLWEVADVGTEYPSMHGSIESGTIAAFHAIGTLKNDPNCTYTWDDTAKIPTLYCSSLGGESNVLVAYEDGQSWAEKMKYAKEHGLRGAIIWAASDMGNGRTIENPSPGTWGTMNAPDVSGELWQGLFDGYMGENAVTVNPAGYLGRGTWTTKYTMTNVGSSCPLDGETPVESCVSGSVTGTMNFVQAHNGVIQGAQGIVRGSAVTSTAAPTAAPITVAPVGTSTTANVVPVTVAPAVTSAPTVAPVTVAPAVTSAPTVAPVTVAPVVTTTAPTVAPVTVAPAVTTTAPTVAPVTVVTTAAATTTHALSDMVVVCKTKLTSSTTDWAASCESLCEFYAGSAWCQSQTTGADLAKCVVSLAPYCTLA